MRKFWKCLNRRLLNSYLSLSWVFSPYNSAQCVHCTVFFPFDRVRWDTLSNLVTVVLLNIYLSQRARSKGTLRKLDFRESQTLNLWISLKYSPVVTTKCAPLFPLLFPDSNGDSPVATIFPCSYYGGFFTTGEYYCTMYTLCSAAAPHILHLCLIDTVYCLFVRKT